MQSERWANPEEIRSALDCNTTGRMTLKSCSGQAASLNNDTADTEKTGGPVLYYDRGYVRHYGGEGHTMYLGTSGAGKSRRGTLPLIRTFIRAGEAYIAVDPKGELYRATVPYAFAEGYEVITIDFRRIFESARFSPLEAPYELYKSGNSFKKQIAMELIDELAFALYPVHEKTDPFWPESARSLFIAAVYALFDFADADQVNMASVYQLVAKGETRMGPTSYLKSFVDNLPSTSIASMLFQSYVNTASDTKAGIRSTFLEGLSMFARSDGLLQMLSGDDIHINQLTGDKKLAIYLILPDETPIFDSVCAILCGQLMSHFIRLAEDKYSGRLPIRHNFVIEELGNIGGALKNLPHMLSAGRSRNVRCQYVLQSLSQLGRVFSSADATTIISNTDVVVAFRTNNYDTLAELSRMCGERDIVRGGHTTREPLITPTQLGAMQTGQALVTVSGALRFVTWLPDYEEMFDCTAWTPPKRQIRTNQGMPNVFDIVSFMSESQKKKLHGVSEETPKHAFPAFAAAVSNNTIQETEKRDNAARAGHNVREVGETQFSSGAVSEKAGSTYEVLIVSVGGSCKPRVVKAVSEACKTGITEATKRLEVLPAFIQFNNKREAVTAAKAISDAGGIAFVQEQ